MKYRGRRYRLVGSPESWIDLETNEPVTDPELITTLWRLHLKKNRARAGYKKLGPAKLPPGTSKPDQVRACKTYAEAKAKFPDLSEETWGRYLRG